MLLFRGLFIEKVREVQIGVAVRAHNIAFGDLRENSFALVVTRDENRNFDQLVGRVTMMEGEAGRTALSAD